MRAEEITRVVDWAKDKNNLSCLRVYPLFPVEHSAYYELADFINCTMLEDAKYTIIFNGLFSQLIKQMEYEDEDRG